MHSFISLTHNTLFQLRPLTPIPPDPSLYPAYMLTHLPMDDLVEELPLHFLGRMISDPALACAIADGLVDPVSKVCRACPIQDSPIPRPHSISRSR